MNIENLVKDLIKICNVQNAEITLMDLNKLLYDSWVKFYNMTDRYLFDEHFIVTSDGPVIESISNDFNMEMDRVIRYDGEYIQFTDRRAELAINAAMEKFLSNVEESRKNTNRKGWKMVYDQQKEMMIEGVFSIPWDWIVENDCYEIKDGVIVQVDIHPKRMNSYSLYFKVPSADFDLEANMKEAIKDFAKTEKGKDFFYHFPFFEWGNVSQFIAIDDFLYAHNIKIVEPFSNYKSVGASDIILSGEDAAKL